MKQTESVIGRLTRKISDCLAQEGIEAELDLSEHEGTVAARTDVEGKSLKVIFHVSDRELTPSAYGSVPKEEARARLLTATVRPTLEQRSGSGGSGSRQGPRKDDIEDSRVFDPSGEIEVQDSEE